MSQFILSILCGKVFHNSLPQVWGAKSPKLGGVVLMMCATLSQTGRNLRTRFDKIQIRAGLVPIPKFFTNCRASRSTEVFEKYGAFLESQWIGHSHAVAMRHYFQVRDVDFQSALGEYFSAVFSAKGGQNESKLVKVKK